MTSQGQPWHVMAGTNERRHMEFLSSILAAAGTSVIVCCFMEAYFVRRATEEMGDYDEGNE